MKKFLISLMLFVGLYANQTVYTINNSKLIDGNSMIFYNASSNEYLTIAVNNNRLKLPNKFLKKDYKFNKIKNFFGQVICKNKFLTIPQLLNKIAKSDNKNILSSRDIIIAYGDKIYMGKLEIDDLDDEESIFDDIATVSEISFRAIKEFDLNSFSIRNRNDYIVVSLSKDNNGNILSFNIFDKQYKLINVINRHLIRYNSIKKALKKSLNFDKAPITVKYIKRDKRGDVIIREVHYKLVKKGKYNAVIINIMDKSRESGTVGESYGELYRIKQKILFQLKGGFKVNSFEKYSFEQYPSNMIVKVKSNNSFSSYYRKSIYYYNKAGLWYLMLWLKKKGLNHKNAYVFYENNNAKLYKITEANSNTIKINEKDAIFFPSTNLIKEYNGFHFFDIENDALKEMRKKYNIIRLYR